MELKPLPQALFNAIFAQADVKERKILGKGKMLPGPRMCALAIDAALAQNKSSGGRHLSEALVSWAARNMERSF